MEKKHTVFSLLEYEEVIGRFISLTSKFEGPSCFPVRITFEATNTTQPPYISVEVMNFRRDSHTETIYHRYVDHDTTLDEFLRDLDELRTVTDRILKSISENIPYEELLEKPAVPDNGDMPF